MYLLNLGSDHISLLFLLLFTSYLLQLVLSGPEVLILAFTFSKESPQLNWHCYFCLPKHPLPLHWTEFGERRRGYLNLFSSPCYLPLLLLEMRFSIYLCPLGPSLHISLLTAPCIILLLYVVWIVSLCQLQKKKKKSGLN